MGTISTITNTAEAGLGQCPALLFTTPHEIPDTGPADFQRWTREAQRSKVTCPSEFGSGSRGQFSALHLTELQWPQQSERPEALGLGVESWSLQGSVSGLQLAPPTGAWPRDMSMHMLGVPFSWGTPKPQ